MPTEKTLALIIRQVDFSETSRVVTMFTRDLGKLGAMVKGARRLRGPFAGALDLLSICRIVLLRKHSDSLDLLTEAELVQSFARPRNSLPVLYAGFYIAELLSELTHEYDPHPSLFDLANDSLRELESGGDVRLVLRRFELGILRETGHMPQLERCAACGRPIEGPGQVAFSVAGGGVLCRSCAPAHRSTGELHAGSVKIARLLLNASNRHWQRLNLQEEAEREIRVMTGAAIRYLVARNLRTTRFLR